MDFSRISIFYSLAPEPVIHADFDGGEVRELSSSLDVEVVLPEIGCGLAVGERDVYMFEAEPHQFIELAADTIEPHPGLKEFTWRLLQETPAKVIRDFGLNWIESTSSWYSRESLLRATKSIQILFNYLYLFGGGALVGDSDGSGSRILNFPVFKDPLAAGWFHRLAAGLFRTVGKVLCSRFFVPCSWLPRSGFRVPRSIILSPNQ